MHGREFSFLVQEVEVDVLDTNMLVSVICVSVMTISSKGEVLAPFQTCCAVTSLYRIRDFSFLLHAAHMETKDMNMVVSFTLVRATFLPKMKTWRLSKRAVQFLDSAE